jgi:hypothetical protein
VIESNRDVIVGMKIAMSKSEATAYPGGAAVGEVGTTTFVIKIVTRMVQPRGANHGGAAAREAAFYEAALEVRALGRRAL